MLQLFKLKGESLEIVDEVTLIILGGTSLYHIHFNVKLFSGMYIFEVWYFVFFV